jgi:hypothetical protein
MSIDAYNGVDHSLQAGPALGCTTDDRRSIGRTRIAKAASLFFSGQTGVRSCDVSVTDITNGGAGIHTQGLAVLPLNFELYVDNFRRKCRLAWRNGNFFGVAFEDQNTQTYSETKVSEAGTAAIPGPAFLALNDPPQFTYLANAEGSSEYTSKVSDRRIQRQADLRFIIGAVIALALPVLIGMSVYFATTAILRAS